MRSCALFLVALMRLATIAGQVEPVDVNVEQVLGNDVLVHYRLLFVLRPKQLPALLCLCRGTFHLTREGRLMFPQQEMCFVLLH